MNVLQHLGRGPGMFRFQIDYLPANHPVYRACPASDLLDDPSRALPGGHFRSDSTS